MFFIREILFGAYATVEIERSIVTLSGKEPPKKDILKIKKW